MSWGYSIVGPASLVKKHASEHLARSAEQCVAIESEVASIAAFAATIKAVCDQAEGQCVKVNGSGSAWLENGKLKSFQFNAKIEVFDMSPAA